MHIQVSLTVDIDATADLASMEAQVQAADHQAMRQALQQGMRRWELAHRTSPRCGSGQGRIEGTVARTMLSLFGAVRIPRLRIRCQQCLHRFCPAQEQHAPASTVRQQPEPEPTSAHRTIIGLDGGWVPNRQRRGGMEGKVAVVASHKVVMREPEEPSGNMSRMELARYAQHHRHPVVTRSRWQTRRYAATFADASVIGRQAAQAMQELGIAHQDQVVVADGAQWIKTQARRHFSEASCILDWPHLWRTIAKAVRAVGLQREEDTKWVTGQSEHLRTWLWKGQIEPAQDLLQRWQQKG